MDQASQRFLGRTKELSIMRKGLDQAFEGHGGNILIAGEAGIGKTSLAEILDGEARSRGAIVTWGRCWEGGGSPSYWPWTQALRALGAVYEAGADASESQQLLADFVTRHARDTSKHFKEEELRFALFEAVANDLLARARRVPILVIFDDLHAADEASILLLQFVARAVATSKILIVSTYREIEVGMEARLSRLFADLRREATAVSLHGLNESEVRSLIEMHFGQQTRRIAAKKLFNVTEGNPFFLHEIMRLSVDASKLESTTGEELGDLPLPNGVRFAIRRRLENISDRTREMLAIASVIGREFDSGLLGSVSNLDSDALTHGLSEAAAHVIVAGAQPAGTFRFCHTLIAETLYEDLPISRRQQLHNLVGSKLEEFHVERDDAGLVRLAHHYTRSLPSGDSQKALTYSQAAAARANQTFAYEDATRLYKSALQALGNTPDDKLRCELKLALGVSELLSGRHPESKVTLEKAAMLAREIGDTRALAEAVLGYGRVASSFGVVDLKLVGMLEEALARLDPRDEATMSRLMARLAQELYWSDDVVRRERLSLEAVRLARTACSMKALLRALYTRYTALLGPRTANERLVVLEELVQLCDENRIRDWRLDASWPRIGEFIEQGNRSRAVSEVQMNVALTAELRRSPYLAQAAQTMLLLLDGRIQEAERLASEMVSTEGHQNPAITQIYASQIAMVRREQGRMAEIEPVIRTIVKQYPALVFARCGLALCYIELGNQRAAIEEFEYMAARDFASLRQDATWLPAMTILAEVCSFIGDAKRACANYNNLIPYRSRFAVLGSHLCYGSVEHYLGLLAKTKLDFQMSAEHFEGALTQNRNLGARLWVVHTQFRYAEALIERNDTDTSQRAVELVESVLASAASLGLKALEVKARALRERLRISPEIKPEPLPVANYPAVPIVATVLFIDVVDSSGVAIRLGDRLWRDLLSVFHATVRSELDNHGGHEIDNAGDGFLAVFDRPASAVQAACAIRRRVEEQGLSIRAGIHAGQCEWMGGKAVGITVHIGARVAAAAGSNEILVSSTVRDLLMGSGIAFGDLGWKSLKGIPEKLRLFVVEVPEGSLS